VSSTPRRRTLGSRRLVLALWVVAAYLALLDVALRWGGVSRAPGIAE
jgi:hypothetical protein